LLRTGIRAYDPAARATRVLFESDVFAKDAQGINQLLYDNGRLYWTEIYQSAPQRISHTRICALDLRSGSVDIIVTNDASGPVPPVVPLIAVEGTTLCYDTQSNIYERSLDQITSSIVIYDLESRKILDKIGGPGETDISPSVRNGVLAFLRLKERRFSVVVRDVAARMESEITEGDISTLSQPKVEDRAVVYWDATSKKLIAFSLADKKTSIVPTTPLKDYYSLGPYVGNNAAAWVVGQSGPKQLAIMNLSTAEFAFIPLPEFSSTVEEVTPTSSGFCWSGINRGPGGDSAQPERYILGFF
jgi:hypothetical protein